jgi:hypothetical protein
MQIIELWKLKSFRFLRETRADRPAPNLTDRHTLAGPNTACIAYELKDNRVTRFWYVFNGWLDGIEPLVGPAHKVVDAHSIAPGVESKIYDPGLPHPPLKVRPAKLLDRWAKHEYRTRPHVPPTRWQKIKNRIRGLLKRK